ncbi:alpha/beta hydrolase [Amycolatopsis minnesotensis]|uniref:Alpha/beta hydrolase n=1 Tax=Amycolatopsis minnesotensis TaxID=337894 RepID=A0ABP5BGN2_9PSEU
MPASATVIAADGVPLAVETAGEGTPILIVPGSLTPPQIYRPLMAALSKRHRVVLLERRGYGENGSRPCRMRYHVEDIVAVLDWIGEPALVFGHSFGAIVALESARAAGTRISALALYEPPLHALGPRLLPMLARARDLLSEHNEAAVVAEFLGAVDAMPPGEDLTQLSIILGARAAGVVSDLECMVSAEPRPERWAELAVPALLLYGDASDLNGREDCRWLADLVPSGLLAGLPGQAHFPDLVPLAAVLGDFAGTPFRKTASAT